MANCPQVDSLLTPYVDGEASPTERQEVETHLDRCPPCQRSAKAESTARTLLRTRFERLTDRASRRLHERCRRTARDRAERGGATRRPLESAMIERDMLDEKVTPMPDSDQEQPRPASKRRWLIALGAVAGVTLIVWGGIRVPGVTRSDVPGAGAGAKCDADAKPANLKFTLKDIDGGSVDLSSYKGKVILLDFWATWCGPCKIEIPGFVDLQNKYRDKGLIVIGVSVDDTIEQLRPFAAAYKMNYPVLLGSGRDDVLEAFGPIWGFPTTYLIGRDGRLCRKLLGLHPAETFEKAILGLL